MESGKLLSNIDLPIDAIKCKSIKCNYPNYSKDIDTFYDNIIESLITATYNALPVGGTSSFGKAVASGYSLIPGWNKAVKSAYAKARNEYFNWLSIGKPLSGPSSCLMKESRKKF